MQLKDSISGKHLLVQPTHLSQDVTIYACGVTPYSAAHVGHARTYAVFDLLAKVLRSQGQSVRLIRNITDIDDKILAAAASAGVPWHELSAFYAQQNRELMQATGIEVPEEPKASEHLPEIFWLIEQLMGLGLAYVAPGGDVLYRVSAYTGQTLMKHQEGALRSEAGASRVDSTGKEDARDFALWKAVSPKDVGFSSPWGWGRPGWHIECSAMIKALTGGSVSIHGGGVDLKFPHHQAEIMQSEPVIGQPLANIWMHNGSVLSNGRKMSKSEGNFVTWQQALEQAEDEAPGLGGELLRFALLQTHWQKPMDWTSELLVKTAKELRTLTAPLPGYEAPGTASEVIAILDSNLNMPQVMATLRQLHKEQQWGALHRSLAYLGISVGSWAQLPEKKAPVVDEFLVQELRIQRADARKQRNWALADELRARLLELGVADSDQSV
ncbi:cysteine--tRNA ligase [Comamonas thiooxydans]|uniref:cysteine--tRNA ligase n=1 Tax=Comamonas thiooxydans TaxID=363952 RepID=UPI000B419234|nr:cysteine--tRNA ligase [Comamonas thiooxydans]